MGIGIELATQLYNQHMHGRRHLILLQVQFDEGKREAVLLATVSLRERKN